VLVECARELLVGAGWCVAAWFTLRLTIYLARRSGGIEFAA
jgi:hypothetical protein